MYLQTRKLTVYFKVKDSNEIKRSKDWKKWRLAINE